MTTGQRIKACRECKDMSQEELAKACGFKGRSSISRIEKDEGGIPSKKLEKIASVLEVTPQYLFGWTDEPSEIMKGDSMDDKMFALGVRRVREKQNLTIEQLAKRAGVSEARLLEIELGFATVLLAEAKAIADALGVQVDALILGTETRSGSGVYRSAIKSLPTTKGDKNI